VALVNQGYRITIRIGIATVKSPRRVPRRDSITGLRLCSGIVTKRDFTLGNVAKGGSEDDDDAGQTCEADEGEAEVRTREDGPGFHVFVSTVFSIACLGDGGKGG
jgi:hypothetical protein